MKTKFKDFQVVSSFEMLDELKKQEAMKISFKTKLKTVTMLREVFYGRKASTGRVQRVHSVVKLGES